MKAPLPKNEADRLAALRAYDVLDTAPEEAFDDLTLLAAHICQVPTAMVSLVDEKRQWFKSRIGMSATETSREIAFCAHTILHADEVLEVHDAQADPRFADNALVTEETKIRFYAGAPLVAPDGHTLGALCVMDRMPRKLTPEQRTALQALSRRVVAQLELRRHSQKLLKEEQETARLLGAAEKSRLALLSLVEDQRLAETRMQRQQTELRALFDLMPAMIWFKDADNVILRVNQRVAEAAGRTVAEIEGKPSQEIYHGEAARFFVDDLEVIRSGTPKLGQIEMWGDSASEKRWLQTDRVPVRDKSGKVVGIVVMAQDITNRRRTEEALREKDALIRIAGRVTRTGGWVLEIPSLHLFWSDEVFEILGYPLGKVPPLDEILGLYTDEWREMTKAALAACVEVGAPFDLEVEILTYRKKRIWVRVCGEAKHRADGSVERVQGAFQDISGRKQADFRVKLQQALTAVLAEAASTIDINYKILETLCHGLEWEFGELWLVDRVAKALRCAEICHPRRLELIDLAAATRKGIFTSGAGFPGRVWASGKTEWCLDVMGDANFERKGAMGPTRLRAWIGFPIKIRQEILGVLGFFSAHLSTPDSELFAMLDALGAQIGIFLERRQLAEQFRQAQKMEAIGTLAGGIAHDFNNVLAAINGYTELAIWEVEGNAVATEYLGSVMQGTKRAADLVRQILAFSRRQELERKPLQLRVAVEEALKLLRATIPATIEFKVTIAPKLPNVLADATQVHQVLMNLCTNAAHAMRERPGRLTVKMENYEVDSAVASILPGLRGGSYVRLSVSDTGCGMDPGTLSRIFEPFFTTKPPGEGTGLGLAVVHGIMQSHEGAVSVYSHVGDGTTFHLYFPAHAKTELASTVKSGGVPRGNGERVLYVDDEHLLAKMGKTILERLGYVVDSRTNATEALAAVRAEPTAYDLLVTDYMMPVMTGTALAEMIRGIRGDLPIILTTGYSATLTAERVQAMGIQKLILKPLSVDALGSAVFNVLKESKSN